jgi:hypothetical protein
MGVSSQTVFEGRNRASSSVTSEYTERVSEGLSATIDEFVRTGIEVDWESKSKSTAGRGSDWGTIAAGGVATALSNKAWWAFRLAVFMESS